MVLMVLTLLPHTEPAISCTSSPLDICPSPSLPNPPSVGRHQQGATRVSTGRQRHLSAMQNSSAVCWVLGSVPSSCAIAV